MRLLHIAGPDVHLDSVAHRLTEPQIWPRGITNPHWAPQHMFCGGLTNSTVRRYTSVIPYRDIKGGLAAVVVGRLPPDHGVRAALGGLLGVDWDKNGTAFTRKSSPPPPPANGHTHIFHSERMVCQLSSESWALLAKAYWADYELQESQHLPLEIEAECRKPSGSAVPQSESSQNDHRSALVAACLLNASRHAMAHNESRLLCRK